MIGRVLGRGREPGSIFEHIDAHIRPGVDGLADGGGVLPDEPIAVTGELAFAPGALEGVFAGPGDPAEVAEAVARLYAALAALAAKPSAANRRKLRERFREGGARLRIDALRERLAKSPPEHAVRLYPELRELFLRSGHRDEVKFAMALMSGFRRPEDADLFRIVGRHEEFTLYAAVALATVSDDPLGDWLALLPHVRGWGRSELVSLILREPRSREVREQLVRAGVGFGDPVGFALGVRLDELLARPDVDDLVLAGARDVLHALADGRDSAWVLTEYEHAGPAVEAYVARVSERGGGLEEFVAVAALRRFLADDGNRATAGATVDRFEASGLTAERLERVVVGCDAFLAHARWRELAIAALESDGERVRALGGEAAQHLGIDLREHLIGRLARDPGDSTAWFRLCADADEARMREAVDLALELWDLSEIAGGAASERLPEPPGPLSCVGHLVRELPRFPGVGGELLEATLQSPVSAHRTMALRALSRWEHLPAELVERLAVVRASDPDDDVRERAAKVLAGEEITGR